MKLKNLARKIINRDDISFILVALMFLVLLHYLPIANDDIFRMMKYSGMSFKEMLRASYENSMYQSMRIASYFVVDTLIWMKHGYLLWQLINTVVIYLFLRWTSYIIIEDKRLNPVLSLLFCIWPYYDMMTAGQVSTSVTYIWTLTVAVGVISIFKYMFEKGRLNPLLYIIFIPMTFFATNQEQALSAMLFTFGALLVYSIAKKNRVGIILSVTELIISAVNVKLLLFMPARDNRYVNELFWYKDYPNQSFINKIEMGVTSTLHRVLFTWGLFVILMVIITYFAYKRCKGNYRWMYLPVISLVLAVAAYLPRTGFFGKLSELLNTSPGQYGMLEAGNYYKVTGYVVIILQLVVAFGCLIAIGTICDNYLQLFIAEALLVVGMGTRVVMGFSPTIWASSDRTYLFIWYAIVLECLYLMRINKKYAVSSKLFTEKNEKYIRDILFILIIVAFLCNAWNILDTKGYL